MLIFCFYFDNKLATFWATFLQAHLVTLPYVYPSILLKVFDPRDERMESKFIPKNELKLKELTIAANMRSTFRTIFFRGNSFSWENYFSKLLHIRGKFQRNFPLKMH
jgi:hypothetical protein